MHTHSLVFAQLVSAQTATGVFHTLYLFLRTILISANRKQPLLQLGCYSVLPTNRPTTAGEPAWRGKYSASGRMPTLLISLMLPKGSQDQPETHFRPWSALRAGLSLSQNGKNQSTSLQMRSIYKTSSMTKGMLIHGTITLAAIRGYLIHQQSWLYLLQTSYLMNTAPFSTCKWFASLFKTILQIAWQNNSQQKGCPQCGPSSRPLFLGRCLNVSNKKSK